MLHSEYLRFMDDWVVLTPNRWKLREAVRVTNQCLAELKVEKHPDKTFVGRVERGFDFLGYQFHEGGLTGLSRRSVHRLVPRPRDDAEDGGGSRER